MSKFLKAMRLKRADISTSLTTILWAMTGVAGTSAVGWGVYHVTHQGSNTTQTVQQSMAQKLWKNSAPIYSSQVVNGVATVSVAPPQISTVDWNTNQFTPGLSITGINLGQNAGSGKSLVVTDTTRGWQAADDGSTPVGASISGWNETGITVAGFAPDYGNGDFTNYSDGNGSFIFAPGDNVTITVTSADTGQSTSISTTVPSTVGQATVTLNPLPTNMVAGQTYTITGNVNYNGSALNKQAVSLSATDGTFSGGINGKQVTPQEYMVNTDSSGNFSVTYSPPGPNGSTQTITMSADGKSQSQSASVAPAFTVTLTATPNSYNNNVVLTASSNRPVNGYTMSIIDQTTGQTIASTTSGTTLSTTITAVQNQTETYIAQIN